MELANTYNKYIIFLGCKRCKTKDERELKKNFDHCSWYCNWDEEILLDDSQRCVPIQVKE